MANQLKMAMVDAIWTLRERGWSQRRIAKELGINRETVARYLNSRPHDPKPATNAPTGSLDPKAGMNLLNALSHERRPLQDAQYGGQKQFVVNLDFRTRTLALTPLGLVLLLPDIIVIGRLGDL